MHIPRHTHNYYTMHIPRHTHIKHVIYGPGHIHTYTHVIKWYALRIFNPLSDWALHVCVFTCNYHSHLFMFTCYTQGTQRTNFTSEWEPSCSRGAGQIFAWRAKVSSIGLQAHKLNNILAYNPTWVLRMYPHIMFIHMYRASTRRFEDLQKKTAYLLSRDLMLQLYQMIAKWNNHFCCMDHTMVHKWCYYSWLQVACPSQKYKEANTGSLENRNAEFSAVVAEKEKLTSENQQLKGNEESLHCLLQEKTERTLNFSRLMTGTVSIWQMLQLLPWLVVLYIAAEAHNELKMKGFHFITHHRLCMHNWHYITYKTCMYMLSCVKMAVAYLPNS